jgi:hypothetical protein
MIVPAFWAEGRVHEKRDGKQVTIRRFGWSDESQAAAQAHADDRAREAFAAFKASGTTARFEYKRAYNGADGVPIREEILERHAETIITRNSYGARCLNTPNVLFADVDVRTEGFAATMRNTFGGLLRFVAPKLAQDPWVAAEERIRSWAASQPRARWRLYRTPAGFRLLAVHRTYASDDPEVTQCFAALGVDPIYARMCTRQRCFRARVSPKPWRVGITKHLGPAHAAWPIKPERMPQREGWVAEYERASKGHASCRFVAEFGDARVDPQADAVRALHDAMSGAERDLPLA